MKHAANIHIGTSGWHYTHWKGPFYPEDLPASRFLEHYAGCFRTAEINNSFYRLPEKKTLAQWRGITPDGFIFAAKASRYLTHMKKLKDPQEPLERLLDRLDILEDKLGPILFQLPPRWKLNPKRLEDFLGALPEGYRYAVEFRDASWFDERIYEMLAARGVAFCVYDLGGESSPKKTTADFVYARLHGPEGAYEGRYGAKRLSGWAGAFTGWLKEEKEVYCYFDNDEAGYAPQDALRLQQMMTKE